MAAISVQKNGMFDLKRLLPNKLFTRHLLNWMPLGPPEKPLDELPPPDELGELV